LYFKLGGNNHNETETLQRIDAKCIPEIVRVLADYKATIPAKKQRRQEAGVACKKARGIIIIRDAGRCGICGRFVASMNVSIDHIKPVILGGTDEMDNLQLAHRRCNSRKRMRYGANV
jgi:5-methylcytosine-specific restriction endonuclease McrA